MLDQVRHQYRGHTKKTESHHDASIHQSVRIDVKVRMYKMEPFSWRFMMLVFSNLLKGDHLPSTCYDETCPVGLVFAAWYSTPSLATSVASKPFVLKNQLATAPLTACFLHRRAVLITRICKKETATYRPGHGLMINSPAPSYLQRLYKSSFRLA